MGPFDNNMILNVMLIIVSVKDPKNVYCDPILLGLCLLF